MLQPLSQPEEFGPKASECQRVPQLRRIVPLQLPKQPGIIGYQILHDLTAADRLPRLVDAQRAIQIRDTRRHCPGKFLRQHDKAQMLDLGIQQCAVHAVDAGGIIKVKAGIPILKGVVRQQAIQLLPVYPGPAAWMQLSPLFLHAIPSSGHFLHFTASCYTKVNPLPQGRPNFDR